MLNSVLLSDMETLAILPVFVSFITLIVFFFMAGNISHIRKVLDYQNQPKQISYVDSFNKGELREFQGKKQEALDCYMESLFMLNKFIKKATSENIDVSKDVKNKEMLRTKITELGGTYKDI